MSLHKWMKRTPCALLAACICLTLSVPAWAAENAPEQECLSITESALPASVSTQSLTAVQEDDSNIQLSLTVTQDNKCMASGMRPYNGIRLPFLLPCPVFRLLPSRMHLNQCSILWLLLTAFQALACGSHR